MAALDGPVRSGQTALGEFAGTSLTGRSRTVNEDAFAVLGPAEVFVVADGCGGTSSGRQAADIAVESFHSLLASGDDAGLEGPLPAGADPLAQAMDLANRRILEAANGGMGCALAALRLGPRHVTTVHAGDCQIYRYRRGENGGDFHRLSMPHELWLALLRQGAPVEQALEARRLHGNVITRALGVQPDTPVELHYEPARSGDLYLLCSDGLTRQLGDDAIRALVADEGRDLAVRCRDLVLAADRAIGSDNVTALLVRLCR